MDIREMYRTQFLTLGIIGVVVGIGLAVALAVGVGCIFVAILAGLGSL